MSGIFKKTEKENTKKYYIEAIIYLLAVSCAVAVFCLTKSLILYFPLLAVASAFFGMTMIRFGQNIGMIYLIAASVVLFFFSGTLWELFLYLSVFLPAGVALFLSVSYKKNFNSSIASAFLATVVFTAVIFLVFVWENSEPFSFDAAFASLFNYVKEIIAESYDLLNGLAEAGGVSFTSLTKADYVSVMFSQLLISVPVLYSALDLMFLTFSNRIIKALFGRTVGKGEKETEFFGKLRYFKMSTVGGVFYLISNLIYIFLDGQDIISIFLNIFVNVMSFILAFEGLAVIVSFMALKEVKKPLRILTVVLAVFLCFTPLGIFYYLLTLIGLWDCLYNVRRFFNGKGGKIL